jgi:hypothetical protein
LACDFGGQPLARSRFAFGIGLGDFLLVADVLHFVGAGRGRRVNRLAAPLLELLEAQRAVVEGSGQAEAVVNQTSLRARSPLYMPRICGMVWWLSSTISR